MRKSCKPNTKCLHNIEDEICHASEASCPTFCIYSNILDKIDTGVLISDGKKGTVIYQNSASVDMFEDLTLPRDYHILRTFLLPYRTMSSTPDNFSYSRTIHYGNRILDYSIHLISDDYCCIFTRDVTEKARLESIAEAVNIMDNIGYVFSGIRHEIGNPINSIKMTMSVLRNNLEKFSGETVLQYVDRGLAEISRVEYLLKSLRNYSMFEKLDIKAVNLPDFMEKLLYLVSNDFMKKGIKIESELSPETKWVLADPRALQQVMLNLLANASDALERMDNPLISISSSKTGDLIWIFIEDNGCGMTGEEQKHLFKPFYTTKANGTGLGLVITGKLLFNMNANIEIKSVQHRGTRVTMCLPEGSGGDT